MRIAGGVLLIVVAVVNLIAGCGYVAGGALAGAAGGMAEGLGDAVGAEEGGEESGAEMSAEGAKMSKAGGNMKNFGYFKIVLGGLEIAAGVVLMVGTAAMLAQIAAGLEIINVVAGAAFFVGVSVFSAVGLVAGILAFLGAQSIGASAAGGGGGAAPPPPAAEG